MLLAFALLVAAGNPTSSPTAEPEKKICRNVAENTGSIMPKRECRTKSEWAAAAKANQKNADNYRNNRAQGGMPRQGQ